MPGFAGVADNWFSTLSDAGSFVENPVIARIIDGFDLDAVHSRRVRSSARPIDQQFDRERFALHERFDRAVMAVSDPAGNLQLDGALAHRLTEEDALDQAVDAQAAGDFQDLRDYRD